MPIDFTPSWLDSDLRTFQDNVGRFLDEEMLPNDERDRKRGHIGPEIWRRAGELGLLMTDIPEEYGGGGGDFRHEAVIYDAMRRRGLTGMANEVHTIVAHYILNHGTEDQKRRFLPRMASGELIGAIGMSEPGAGSDLKGIRTRAVRDGDAYVINGSKIFTSNGFLAGLVLVVCKTDPSQRNRGMSILLLETKNAVGYRVGKLLDKIGTKAQDTAELFFDDVRVPAANLLGGEEGKGFAQMMTDLMYERLLVGVITQASMEAAYAATLDYVRQRQAFGKTLWDFQNTRFKLAECAATIKVSRTFVDHCVQEYVAGRLDNTTASMLKLWVPEQNCRVVDECLQLHGGYGYMNEYLVARLYTDARHLRIAGGAAEIMKELIARDM